LLLLLLLLLLLNLFSLPTISVGLNSQAVI